MIILPPKPVPPLLFLRHPRRRSLRRSPPRRQYPHHRIDGRNQIRLRILEGTA
jgi:hypothetical protein